MRRHDFSFAALPVTPWKNGGGDTREIVCRPSGAGADDFDWRISIATIARDGPFSVFGGVQRTFTLLDGDGGDGTAHGVHLRSADRAIDRRIARPLEPFAFDGAIPVDCRLLGGASTGFNVMARRGHWRASVSVVDDEAVLAPPPQGLIFAARGTWQIESVNAVDAVDAGLRGAERAGAAGAAPPRASGAGEPPARSRRLSEGDGYWWIADDEARGDAADREADRAEGRRADRAASGSADRAGHPAANRWRVAPVASPPGAACADDARAADARRAALIVVRIEPAGPGER